MTQQHQDRIVAAQTAYFKTSSDKERAEAVAASDGAAMDSAQRYAAYGVKSDIANLQNNANADYNAKAAAFQVAFQAASDATNINGAAYLELQNATRDGLTAPGPGSIEQTNPNATPPWTK